MQKEINPTQHSHKKSTTYPIAAVLFLILLFGLTLLCILKPATEYSDAERRKLAAFPEFSAETISSGQFMQEFEEYALDQFPFRDEFRSLKAWVSDHIFLKKDDNGIYVSDGYAVKMEYPMNEASLEYAGKRFGVVYNKYLKDSSCRIYLSIIPDKNYFLAEETGHLSMDYDLLAKRMQEQMPYAAYIDIYGLLSIEDYYRTDIHWRQEQLTDVAEYIGDSMGVELNGGYEVKVLNDDFHGVYSGQTAVPLNGEKLYYLTNEVLDQCVVYNHENNETLGIYNMEKAAGRDPYEMYLSGSISLLTIEKPAAETERELIVFRDSFGSSLVPLLAEGYSRITLVDIRYMQSGLLERFLEFEDQDVLFLYSTPVLNNSETLK